MNLLSRHSIQFGKKFPLAMQFSIIRNQFVWQIKSFLLKGENWDKTGNSTLQVLYVNWIFLGKVSFVNLLIMLVVSFWQSFVRFKMKFEKFSLNFRAKFGKKNLGKIKKKIFGISGGFFLNIQPKLRKFEEIETLISSQDRTWKKMLIWIVKISQQDVNLILKSPKYTA